MDNKLLTDEEIQTVLSMGQYWEEVSKREDRSPLGFELIKLGDLLGTRLLFITLAYARIQANKKEVSNE